MRTRGARGYRLLGLVLGVTALAGCGRSGFQYVESEDAHFFAKIPDDWTITASGIVNPTLVPDEATSFMSLPGDDTLPWRAEFTAGVGEQVDGDLPFGYIGAQPVDSRLRDSLELSQLVPVTDPSLEYEVVDTRQVESGELDGIRSTLVFDADGTEVVTDRLVLTDGSRTAVYVVQITCSRTCIEQHADVIDEIMQTFTVERS